MKQSEKYSRSSPAFLQPMFRGQSLTLLPMTSCSTMARWLVKGRILQHSLLPCLQRHHGRHRVWRMQLTSFCCSKDAPAVNKRICFRSFSTLCQDRICTTYGRLIPALDCRTFSHRNLRGFASQTSTTLDGRLCTRS